jgi:hypothetical protein
MNLFNRPFFRSAAGKAWLIMQSWPIAMLALGLVLGLFSAEADPMNAVWIALFVEAVITGTAVILYRVEVKRGL